MSLARSHDWPARLMAQVEAARGRAFAWGSADCCLFVGDCILAMTGVDPAAHFRGRYKTASGARRSLKAFCGGGVEALAERIARDFGLPEVPPLMAQRGDAVLIDAPECPPERKALGICLGSHIAAQGPGGFAMIPLARGLRAWRV